MIVYNIVAHGALGNWDEMIFLGVSVIFVVMMGISWVRSRNMEPEFDENSLLKSNTADSDIEPATTESGDRFKLD